MENGVKESQPLPHSDDAEQALLGCMINGGEREHEIAIAWVRQDNAFYNEDNKIIWKAIKDLKYDGIKIDFITLNNKIKDIKKEGMAYYITGLVESVPTIANVEHYARIVWERYIQRETAKSAHNLVNASYDDYTKVGSILEKHNKLINELRTYSHLKEKILEI